jgi:hypothetical protein
VVVVPFALRGTEGGGWIRGVVAAVVVAWCLGMLYRHVFPAGVRRREPADRAFLVAWLEHRIGVPVTVRAAGAAGQDAHAAG